MTYLLLSLPFLLGAAALWGWRRHAYAAQGKVTAIVAAVLLTLTVVFDNLMVAAGLVEYDGANNLGIYLGLIPVEDLFYTVFVCLVISALWPGEVS
ncbi:lycopene cyclase domain-containing protein [Corynebacterium lipophiloflavum]|uniref:Lycopene cyclase domain protein n=1 Tax=Corynebacterium lipophiloflavum (strain ATCC 700352 / DSM 44291 / CCUG 37336 / JCM 10383 / DMMZ 1944) TaxID=525263 RepID=C0XQ00_CORLD|nr:lycopene cyclase domain-containing protein [Corynebacterium lipophiloflavum]EEI17731.1 lycopene cyclase domain protein [Corynebacterium lipophiloflavum DSM 44291]